MAEIIEIRNKILKVETALEQKFFERDDEARGLSLAALSGHHIFFIGPPGTAKSQMIRWYCDRFDGASYFQWLLTRFSTPEELFGPVDLTALKDKGMFRRITAGKAPEAHIAFLDEVFKSNSAILNSLLSWLQERIYHNDGTPTQCPLIFAAAASNELPEEDEALSALYDRFLLRYNLNYIKDRKNFLDLMTTGGGQEQKQVPTITQAELTIARDAVAHTPITVELTEAVADLRDNLRQNGIIISDRRFVQALSVFKAESWLRGDDAVLPETIEAGGNIFWDKPDDARKVRGICLQVSNPNLYKAQQILEAAEEAAASILDVNIGDDGSRQAQAIQVSSQLKRLADDLDELAGKSKAIGGMAKKVRALNKEVVRRGVGLDVD